MSTSHPPRRRNRRLQQAAADHGVITASAVNHIPADTVIIGAGITPNIGLAQDAGLTIDNGIKVDEHLRTSDHDIYAAGDVANAFHPLLARHIRVEHWAKALHQAPVAMRPPL